MQIAYTARMQAKVKNKPNLRPRGSSRKRLKPRQEPLGQIEDLQPIRDNIDAAHGLDDFNFTIPLHKRIILTVQMWFRSIR